jgi:hypothetical protein
MSFLKKHKLTVALVAVLGLSAGAFHFTTGGCPLAGSEDCLLGSIFSATTAYAGVGCSKTCDSDAKATTAAAKSTDASHCTKESCVKAIMAEKKVSQVEAEAIYAKMVSEGSCSGAAKQASFASSSGCSASKASVETASASGCSASKASIQTVSASGCSGHSASAQTASASGCSGSAKTTASFANATESKTCGDKEACIAKCMAEKGLTRAEAEACYEKCQAAKATQANVIEGSGFTRESWIDAKVASGMTRSDAEVAAAKAEASGDVKFITASASGCSATKVSATGSSCCASKASANTAAKVEETTPATATTVSTGGTK